METKIKFFRRNVYGRDLMYPACKQSKLACALTDSKTFHTGDITTLRSMGFEIIEVLESQSELK